MHKPPPIGISSSAQPGESRDPIDDLTESVTDGRTVDWQQAESIAQDDDEKSHVRGLHDLERIVEHHRLLQRTPSLGGEPERLGPPRGTVAPGQWGQLTLLELASAGASGEVWRAWDVWLQREVALKFLLTVGEPEQEDAGDTPLLDEARALARVRHPGVVAVYGIGEHGGRIGMWMELLRGSTLEAEIARRGAMPPFEVARIGLDLCRALEEVASAGLVHRDIKPANIVLETNGRVVLTDFGLGRRLALAELQAWRTSGTPLFMSPDVLAGEPATPRSDLYALGVTLRWALTGRTPFKAHDLEELKAEATVGPSTPMSSERPDAPEGLIRAIERAMAPHAEARWGSAAQMAEALEGELHQLRAADSRGLGRWRRIAIATALVSFLGTTVLVMPRILTRRVVPALVRFSITAPPNTTLFPDPASTAVSPDGRLLAFAALESNGTRKLWVRPLDSHAPRPLEGTEGAALPFWSPDSRNLGFFAEAKLKKISVSGGPPEILCTAPDPRGGTWGTSGVIVFAPLAVGPLCRSSADGGEVTEIQRPDSTRQETALRWPQFLPDGKHFLFVSLPPREANFDVHAASIDSKGREFVMTTGAAPLCAGEHGLILASNGRLWSQRFDFRRLEPVGTPVALGVASSFDVSVGQPLASVSLNGVLVRPAARLPNTELAWLDRAGRQQNTVPLPEGRYERFSFSPDGRRVLVERRTSPTVVDLWMVNLESRQATRFTYGSQSRIGGLPTWSPDGSRIAFSSNRSGTTSIYQRQTDATGEEELLYESAGQFKEVSFWSHDGRYIVFEQAGPQTSWDLWLLPLEGERKPIPYLRTRFGEVACSISPDGRWMAYTSDVTGNAEIYVRSFPRPAGENRVTHAGGVRPTWSKDDDEIVIYNHDTDDAVWSVPVSTVPTFKAGSPRLLFRKRPDAPWLAPTPDCNRFLATIPVGDVEPTTIEVDLNWPALVER
jgi:serine/threonine protein kinase